jgi:ferredoxin-NADP reductase
MPVARKCTEGSDGASLWLDVPQDLATAFAYRAGQFIAIEADIGGETLIRQYSLSSTPELDLGLRITVKKVPEGRVSSWLVDEVEAGEILEVTAPRGLFFKPLDEPRHVLLLAAGSGVAPMIPISRSLLGTELGHVITFAYGNRTPETIILKDEVDALAKDPAGYVEHVLSRADDGWAGARGRIDRAYLEVRLPAWESRSDLPMTAYLCGPEAFMDVAESALMQFGLGQNDIRRESFDLVLNDEDDGPPIAVTSDDPSDEGQCELITAVVGGEEVKAAPQQGETILDTLLRVKADVPFSCQEGTCSSCISKLTGGSAQVRPAVLKTLRQDDLDEGLVLACLSRPTSRQVRIDFDNI